MKTVPYLSIDDLISNKAKYHGQYIQTAGFYRQGFEESAIYYVEHLQHSNPTIKLKEIGKGLWIDFNHNKVSMVTLDSIQDKLVIVRGIFDTTHLGIYVGKIKNVLIVDWK